MSLTALTSAEISLPAQADGARVSDRIAVLADTVDVVGLTDNHAGQPRMSPLAAVALAREQGVGTIVHVSCRDRNRLALQSQVVGAAALGASSTASGGKSGSQMHMLAQRRGQLGIDPGGLDSWVAASH